MEIVADILCGRWKSQITYAGVELGIFDCIGLDKTKSSESISKELGLNESLLYRLLRALSTLNLLNEKHEDNKKLFSLTEAGKLLCKEHPQSWSGRFLLEEGPVHYNIWKHLTTLIQQGKQNSVPLELGFNSIFEYSKSDPKYAKIFNQAMSSYSTEEALIVLNLVDFSKFKILADIGGGHGYLLCSILEKYKNLKGIVMDLKEVVEMKDELWSFKKNVQDRCEYIGGNFFEDKIPKSDSYILKHIIHDWSDEQSIKILKNISKSAEDKAHIFICELIIPPPNTKNSLATLFDIHMMIGCDGRERTQEEFEKLFSESGWKFLKVYSSPAPLKILEAEKI
jgi:DNA-binding PadR family transcriptional regulator